MRRGLASRCQVQKRLIGMAVFGFFLLVSSLPSDAMDIVTAFPLDVWDLITRELDCYSVCNLYQTSKRAQFVLENGGLTSLSLLVVIGTPEGSWSPLKFSARLRKLKHLCLRVVRSEYSIKEPHSQDFAFPSTLASLALEAVYLSNESLHKILTAGITTLSIPESDYVLKNCVEILSPTNVTSLTFTPGKQDARWEVVGDLRFPNRITSLSMLSLPYDDKLFLPKGLLSFSSAQIGISKLEYSSPDIDAQSRTTSLLSRLPTTLTRLQLPSQISFEQLAPFPALQYLRALPSHRCIFTWLLSFPRHIEVAHFWHDYKHLIRLSRGLPVDDHLPLRGTLSTTVCQYLPPNVTSLDITKLDSSKFDHFVPLPHHRRRITVQKAPGALLASLLQSFRWLASPQIHTCCQILRHIWRLRLSSPIG